MKSKVIITEQDDAVIAEPEKPKDQPTNDPPRNGKLSKADAALVAEFDRKADLLSDLVYAVIEGRETGLMLFGRGGSSKSYTVRRALKQRGDRPLKEFQGRMTVRALYDQLCGNPKAIHLFEDMEDLPEAKDADTLLRSALHGQADDNGKMIRRVSWNIMEGSAYSPQQSSFNFYGGIVMISNRSMKDSPELRAMATRIKKIEHIITNAETGAKMRQIALSGWTAIAHHLDADEQDAKYSLSPDECGNVTEYVIDTWRTLGRIDLDFRMQQGAFSAFSSWRDGIYKRSSWQDIVKADMAQQIAERELDEQESPKSAQKSQVEGEQKLAVKIYRDTGGGKRALSIWKKETGKSNMAFYRRLDDAGIKRKK